MRPRRLCLPFRVALLKDGIHCHVPVVFIYITHSTMAGTSRTWRIKTEKEFRKDYGENWRDWVDHGFTREMDYMLGSPISYSDGDYIYHYSTAKKIDGHYIGYEMITDLPTKKEITDMAKFKKGEMVMITGHDRLMKITSVYDDDEVKVDKLGSYVPFSKVMKVRRTKKTIGPIECYVTASKSEAFIEFNGYSKEFSFYGELDDFLLNNTGMITKFFFERIDEDVTRVMDEFDKAANKTVKSLEKLVLPATKDILLSKVMERYKTNIVKVAELFEETSIKHSLLNIFKA